MEWRNTGDTARPSGLPRTRRMEFLPGQMLLRVRPDALRSTLLAHGVVTKGAAKDLPTAVAEPLDYLRRNAGLREVRPIFSSGRVGLARSAMEPVARGRMAVLSSVADAESEDLAGISVLEIDPKRGTRTLIRSLRASGAIDILEPVPARWLAGSEADPMQNLQWGLRAIGWFGAKRPAAGGVRIGVLDTGVDQRHPDLKGVASTYHHKGLSAQDLIGHGTHVAGILAALTNNSVGIAGVAACKLAVWKIFPDHPAPDGEFYVDYERYLQALNAVLGAGVRVVNLSLGGTASSQVEALLFRRLESRGVVAVAAMGNEHEDGNPVEYPAAYPGVLAVGAIGEDRRRAGFSNTGAHIGLVAPGSNILSTLPRQPSPYRRETDYVAWDGTSMATPHVAGAAALVAARFPDLDAAGIQERLRKTAARLPAMKGKKRTVEYGTGLLNLPAALK